METEEREFLLKNGKKMTIVSPKFEDAEGLAQHHNKVVNETPFLMGDIKDGIRNVEDEIKYISKNQESTNSFAVVAKLDGKIVGLANISGKSKFRVSHRCEIGISVQKEYWGLGIGSCLMQVLISEAKKLGVEQMELAVQDENFNAIKMYKKFGFIDAGCMPNCFKYSDGTYAGLIRMYKDLKGEN